MHAAALISVLVALGTGLVLTTDGMSAWSNLGQALVSGAVVGSVFVAIEVSLTRAAEQRGAHETLVQQLTLTETLVGVDLQGKQLRDLYLPNKKMTAARLRGSDLTRSVLLFADLRHADVRGTILIEADLGGSTLQRARLEGASACGVSFLDADLTLASLEGCDLRDADLSFAVLRNANLRLADLRGARLRHADLSGADLTGALLDEPCGDMLFDSTTIWPSGFAPTGPGTEPPAWIPGMDLATWLVRRAELGVD